MSDLLRNVIHLPLNSVQSGPGDDTVPCWGSGSNAQINGAAKLVTDATFGSVFSLSGTVPEPDYLELHWLTFDSEVAIGAWVRVDPTSAGDTRTLLALLGTELVLGVRTRIDGAKAVVEVEVNHQWTQCEVPHGEWVHLLVAVDTQEVSILVNGNNLASNRLLAPAAIDKAYTLRIGADPNAPGMPFSGQLAHLRVYSALPKRKRAAVWTLDRAPTENFRTYAPLEFELYDETRKPVIYVEGGEIAHRLTLAIWNRDEGGNDVLLNRPDSDGLGQLNALKVKSAFVDLMTLKGEGRRLMLDTLPAGMRAKADAALAGMPNSTAAIVAYRTKLQDYFRHNHHFEVRFPPGILTDKTLAWAESQLARLLSRRPTIDEDAWYLLADRDPIDGSGVLYLHAATTRSELAPQDAASLGPDLTVALPHIAATQDAEGQVMPVEIRPGPLTRRKGDMARLGPRVRLVEVVSQLGKRFIPLHFAVVGGDQVINDDKTETFVLLRLTNIDRESAIAIDRTGNLQTTFTLSCDLSQPGIERDWALVDQPSKARLWINKAQPQKKPPPDPDRRGDWAADPVTARSDGVRMSWEFDGHLIATDSLAPDHSVYMCLGITTGLRTGPSELVLNYRHVPNYWDGARQCRIMKSPLIYDRMAATGENRVGIGTPHPASKLGVAGGISVGQNYADATKMPRGTYPTDNGMVVEGSVGIGTQDPQSKLHINRGRVRISEEKSSATMELMNEQNTNYIFTDGGSGHLNLRTDSSSHHVVLQNGTTQGNVGIGKVPGGSFKLDVNGRIRGTLHGEDLIASTVTIEKIAKAAQDIICPVGSILAWTGKPGLEWESYRARTDGPFARHGPPGWLICDGGFALKSDFDQLWQSLQYNHSYYNNKHWFKVPDLRGRFMRGQDHGAGRDPDAKTRSGGDAVGSVQGDAIASHNHSYNRSYGRDDSEYEKGASGLFYWKAEAESTFGNISGTSFSTETRPKNVYVNFIIKY